MRALVSIAMIVVTACACVARREARGFALVEVVR